MRIYSEQFDTPLVPRSFFWKPYRLYTISNCNGLQRREWGEEAPKGVELNSF